MQSNNKKVLMNECIIFDGEIILLNSTAVQVNLKFFDQCYSKSRYQNELVEDDVIKMFTFSSNNNAEQYQFFDIKIIPLENQTNEFRQYNFILTLKELDIGMIKTENTNQYVYKGYYAFDFYGVQKDIPKHPFYFEITIIVDKFKDIIIETAFRSLNSANLSNQRVETDIYWCKDISCDELYLSTPILHINDQFVLQQKFDSFISQFYYPNDTEVWYTSDGLYKKANILKIDNQEYGKAKILLKADIAWNNFTITIISKQLRSLNYELLKIERYVSGSSDLIECVKGEKSEDCLTCQQQCEINGFAQLSCNSCNQCNLTSILLVILIFSLQVGFVRKCLKHQKKKKKI